MQAWGKHKSNALGTYRGLRVICAFRNEGSLAREAPALGGKPSITADDDLPAGPVCGECDPHKKRLLVG